jgi:hypothetical protein
MVTRTDRELIEVSNAAFTAGTHEESNVRARRALYELGRDDGQSAARTQAAIAALPHNLARAQGLESLEDARRARAVADAVRDADALMAALKKED